MGQGFPQWGTGGSPHRNFVPFHQGLVPPKNFPENNNVLFLNNSLLLKVSPPVNLPGKTLEGWQCLELTDTLGSRHNLKSVPWVFLREIGYQVIPGHGNPQKRRIMFGGNLFKY